MSGSSDHNPSPWDLMQPFDAERFGADVLDPEHQARWSRAMFIGGLPYMWRLARPVLRMIYDLAEIREGDRVLLFGESLDSCGFVADLERIVGPSGTVTPIDIQEDARDAGAAGHRGIGGQIGTFSYARYTSGIAEGAYDIVLNLQGIQHAEDWTVAGTEFLRVMKPGRRLVMAEIVMGAPHQIWKIESDLHIQHLFDKIFSRWNRPFKDIAYYSPDALKSAFHGLLVDMDTFEWRGLEVFSGRKP